MLVELVTDLTRRIAELEPVERLELLKTPEVMALSTAIRSPHKNKGRTGTRHTPERIEQIRMASKLTDDQMKKYRTAMEKIRVEKATA